MIAITLAEIARVVGGRLDGEDTTVSGPAFLDSRAVEPGGLFVAFSGERVDGHAYAAGAVADGAAGVLGARPTGAPTVVVEDVQLALQRLAAEILTRRRAGSGPITVCAITGSQGKTSTKDLLGAILSDAAPTVATYGSFNNELGLPLTVLRVVPETRYLVLEMGARGRGHLAELCAIAPPDISVVLNVGKAHIGEFGSQDAIAQAKGELVEALGEAGTAVLNLDDERVRAMRERTVASVVGFGTTSREPAQVRLTGLELDPLGRPTFDLGYAGHTEHVELRLLGAHHALNAAAATAAAIAAGLSLSQVAASLRGISRLSKWRMELTERPDGVRIINDAYNANPDSMRAALETLAAIGRRTGSPTVAVLGEMRELGEQADAEHRAVGRLVRELGIDRLVVIGSGAAGIVAGATGEGWPSPLHAADVHEAIDHVRETVRAPAVILVKASRGAELERVAAALVEQPATPTSEQSKEAGR